MIPKPATFDDDLKGYPGKPASFAAAKNKIGSTPEHESAGSFEGLVKDYYAGLVAVDDNVGKVFDYLNEKHILDETAIVHTSGSPWVLSW